MTTAPELLGEVVSINNSIMLLLADGAEVVTWRGTSNGTVEFEPEGSDWQAAFDAVYPAEGEPNTFVAVKGPSGANAHVVTLSESGPGRVHVFARGDSFVLVEGYFETDAQQAALHEYLRSLPSPAAKRVGSVATPTKRLALLPTTASGHAFPLELKARRASVELDSEAGLLLQAPAARYDVWCEPVAKGPWGEVTGATLRPAL